MDIHMYTCSGLGCDIGHNLLCSLHRHCSLQLKNVGKLFILVKFAKKKNKEYCNYKNYTSAIILNTIKLLVLKF